MTAFKSCSSVCIPTILFSFIQFSFLVPEIKMQFDGISFLSNQIIINEIVFRSQCGVEYCDYHFYLIDNLINPYLKEKGIEKVDASICIALGPWLITPIGLPTGSAKHPPT